MGWKDAPQEQAAPAWASAPTVSEQQPAWASAPTVGQAPAPAAPTMGNPDSNIRKFLNFLSKAEGASYNTVVGGGSFNDFSKHPRIVGLVTKDGPSTAAGAYQITSTTYDDVASKLGIKDFSERSQDQIAIELIRRNGALQDVAQGNWNAAINKLGGTWASLPSSPYNQPKKSMEWSLAVLNGQTPPSPGYQPFAPVRTNVDPKSLKDDADWLRASALMYSLFERKPFEGSNDDLADYGKTGMANFNFDLVSMAEIAHAVTNASPEEKQAFLYMLDTYDNTNYTWEGTGRATKAALTDPTNLIGIGTLGVATAGKFLGRKAAVEAVKETLLKSLARTGVVAGIDAGVAAAAQETTKQGVEISAGRRQEYDIAKIGIQTGVGAAAGAVLGTAADAAVAKILKVIRGGAAEEAAKAVPAPKPAETPRVPGVAKSAEKKADELLNPKPVLGESTPKTWIDVPLKTNDGREFKIVRSGDKHGDASFEAVDGAGNVIGHSYDLQGKPGSTDIFVTNEDWKGKGVGHALYEASRESAGGQLVPSESLSKDALRYWKRRDPEALENRILEMADLEIASGRKYGHSDADTLRMVKEVGDEPGSLMEEVARAVEAKLNGTEWKPEWRKTANSNVPPVGTRDPNLGSTLTPAEIAEATARKQKGRLEADNVVPNVAGKEDIPIDVPQMNTGLRSTPMSMEELTGLGEKVASQIRGLSTDDLPKALEQLRTGTLPFEETRIVARGVQMAADEVRITKAELLKEINAGAPAERLAELSAKVEALDARLAPLELADDAFGSMAGSILRQRREGLPGVQGVTVESIMKEQNLTKAEAQQVWTDLVSKAEKSAEAQKIAAGYDSQIAATDNLIEKARLAVQKSRELASMGESVAPGGASFIQKLTEFAISNVFSFKTVMVNLIPSGVKTLVIPGLKLIMTDPFSKAARVEAMASYSAMRSSFGAALQAAKAGYKYEQALLTRDGTRLVEGELAMTGKLGGGLRLFPRILNASDEFLSRINYDSFVAGQAAAEAAIKATEAGKTGKALDEAVDKAVKVALRTSREIAKGDELVQPIINKGVNLGLTGDALWKWVEKEAVKNPEALRKGTDEEALKFVRDVLYKREFTGTGTASKAAIQYEETLKKFPSLKLVVGQLFFRTPIRVFEEGVRLTPGLQLLAPNFISDLAGKNGTLRQVRAQAEAMSSLAIAGAVLSLYGQGKITGDGAYSDWKQQRTREDGPLPPPYSILFADGSTWSYRSFDPLATPVKIMINGLERMDRLHLRESQGEFINKDEFDKAMSYITVGTTAVASAIRDANLVAGIDGTIKFFENLADPERKEDAMLKMVGEKLFLLVPNTLHKIAKDNDPTIKDPVTFWQVVEEKLLRPFGKDDIKTPYSYDAIGNVRKLADTGSLWNVFSTSSLEERGRGMSEEGQFVMKELDRLSRVTGATFKAPTKHSELGELDLRTMIAADGKSTLYDVWQKNYAAMGPDKILYPILKEPMPDGTFKFKAARVELVQQTIKDLQDAAFYQMMSQEQKVIDRYIEQKLFEQKAKAGLFDRRAY